MLRFIALLLGIAAVTPVLAAEPDFLLTGKPWRCAEGCRGGKIWAAVKVEQVAAKITVTDELGAAMAGEASTDTVPAGELSKALACKLRPETCGKAIPPSYRRIIQFIDSKCFAIPHDIKGNANSPAPFRPVLLAFNGPDCPLREAKWTTLTNTEWKKFKSSEDD